LNLQLTKVDHWIWIKRTQQQDGKSNNTVTRRRLTQRHTRRRTHKYQKTQLNEKLCENHLLKLKARNKRCRGVILGQKWPKIIPLPIDKEEISKGKVWN
jgi:hypothetical protein